ncbi:LysR family transcriptional regulator [uncultured Ramlibacter sp.]|uniref:LysR family transcriptional regulator n=1 Tax=uncultured Ramlibacter sp. TaxID=260755 RepID=UPI00261C6ED7|nr:LysR family transcriptional regulator [uncultured Ramlibacter sp.]
MKTSTLRAQDGDAAAAMVPLRSLRAVASVVVAGGVSEAARALHQSPSSVTRAVQRAEAMLGIKLFERGALGMTATPAGQILAVRVARALEELQVAADGLRLRGAQASVAALPRLASDTLLQAIVARANHATESAAAAHIGMSQPALHQALRRLEHLAKMPLLERTRIGARLNESGRWMHQQAQLALAEIRVGHEELARWRGQGGTRVVIGTLPMASDVLVPQAVALAMGTASGIHFTVKDGTYESLTQMLRTAEIDFMVGPLRGAALADDLAEEVLLIDRFVAVGRAGHPLLAGGRKASLKRLAAYAWVGPLPGTPAQAVFDRLFADAGLAAPRVILSAHSTAVVRSVLLASDHVALISPLQVRAEVQAGLLAHVSAPLPGSERAIGITQRRDALASSACLEVLAALRQTAVAATLF